MLSNRSIVCYFGFQFLLPDIQTIIRFSYDNPQIQMVAERKSIFLSIAEPHSSLTFTHLTVGVIQRRLFMMSPVHQALMTVRFTRVVDSLNWKVEVRYHSSADIIQPYRQQLLESETSFCDTCHKNCTSPADFVLHQERVHLCLPLFVCPICHFTYITHSCLCMHITESHGGPETAISLI